MNKPNGQYLLPRNEEAVKDFLSKLSIRKVPGIGRVLERILNGLGIKVCSDLVIFSVRFILEAKFGLFVQTFLTSNVSFSLEHSSWSVRQFFIFVLFLLI